MGVILSGGPSSVTERGAPRCDPRLFELKVPVLGICYGMQLACQMLGSTVTQVEYPAGYIESEGGYQTKSTPSA